MRELKKKKKVDLSFRVKGIKCQEIEIMCSTAVQRDSQSLLSNLLGITAHGRGVGSHICHLGGSHKGEQIRFYQLWISKLEHPFCCK